MLEWIEFNPTMICPSAFLEIQPSIKGRFTGCSYCYAAEGMPHTQEEAKMFKEKELTTAQIEDFINQMENLKIKRMCVLGGEPQVREDFDQIISYACEKIPLVHLTTNGIGTKKHLQTLLKIPLLEISVDSNDIKLAAQVRPLKQVEAALESIELLYKSHPFLCINCVVTPSVLPRLWEFIDWAFKERDIKKINLYPLLSENKRELSITREQADKILVEVNKKYAIASENYCKSGKHVIVDYDGSVIPCAAFFGSGVVLGKAENLKEAIENPLMKKFEEYDFKSVAPKNSGSFESSNCPGKKLYDTNWSEPQVDRAKTNIEESKRYCMRCNMAQKDNARECPYCGSTHFDTKPFSMVCSCFSVLNPKFFETSN